MTELRYHVVRLYDLPAGPKATFETRADAHAYIERCDARIKGRLGVLDTRPRPEEIRNEFVVDTTKTPQEIAAEVADRLDPTWSLRRRG